MLKSMLANRNVHCRKWEKIIGHSAKTWADVGGRLADEIAVELGSKERLERRETEMRSLRAPKGLNYNYN